MTKHKELKAEYLALTGKNPKIMSTENLAKEIDNIKSKDTKLNTSTLAELAGTYGKGEGIVKKGWDDLTEEERVAEAARINSQAKNIRWSSEDELIPVFLNGEPHAIIDDKYIPWADAEIMWQEMIVERETNKLLYLKNNK